MAVVCVVCVVPLQGKELEWKVLRILACPLWACHFVKKITLARIVATTIVC